MRRRTTRWLLTFSILSLPAPLAGQAQVALAAGARNNGPEAVVNRALLAAALKPAYTVHLVSDWPRLRDATGLCVNDGEEQIDGTLELTSGGDYVGTLQRTATIRFCGIHGQAREACSLTLESRGPVLAEGEVYSFTTGWNSPVIELRWTTAPADSNVAVTGDCAPAFNDALRRMYQGVVHMLDFPIPAAGEAPTLTRLEDYGWIVGVR